jgi:flavin-binding protein dodecin
MRGELMAGSVYRVTEVIGTSPDSFADAAKNAVETAAGSVRDLRIAEVVRQDIAIEDGQIKNYRVRLAISFKYEASS